MSDDIYSYFKKKTREKNIKIKDIVNKSGVSRTTVYRMIKGIVKPSEEVYNAIVDVLDLNREEVAELNKYIELIDFSCTEIRARKAIAEMLYNDPFYHEDDPAFEMIVYKNDQRYVKNFNEIIEEILNLKYKANFNLNFKILNCIDSNVITILKNLIEEFSDINKKNTCDISSSNSIKIDHLVGLNRDLYDKNVKVLDMISNLLPYNSYNIYFQKENITQTIYTNVENKDIILGTYGYDEKEDTFSKSFILVFSEDDYSDCLIINDKDTFNFFHNLFKKTKDSFKPAIYEGNDFYEFCYLISDFEKDSELCSFNPSPIYKRIPSSIYKNLATDDSFMEFFKCYMIDSAASDYSMKTYFQEFLDEVNNYNNLSKFNKITDVFTVNSLTKFAMYGMLSNHPCGMAEFSVNNRVKILESILEKKQNKNEQYEYFIIDRPTRFNNLIFTSSENKLLIENIFDKNSKANVCYRVCIVEDESIAKSFLDFAENYLPRNLALSNKEAEKFLIELIDNLKEGTVA